MVTPNTSESKMAWGGKPYKGKRMDIKNTDPMNKKPVRMLGNPQAKVFNMENEKDAKAYEDVMKGVIKGNTFVGLKEMLNLHSPFKIYLEWYSDCYTDPETKKNATI